jgi:hypothetical protein
MLPHHYPNVLRARPMTPPQRCALDRHVLQERHLSLVNVKLLHPVLQEQYLSLVNVKLLHPVLQERHLSLVNVKLLHPVLQEQHLSLVIVKVHRVGGYARLAPLLIHLRDYVTQHPAVHQEPLSMESQSVMQHPAVHQEPLSMESQSVMQHPAVHQEPLSMESQSVMQHPAVHQEPHSRAQHASPARRALRASLLSPAIMIASNRAPKYQSSKGIRSSWSQLGLFSFQPCYV